jgi:hypothetical protein
MFVALIPLALLGFIFAPWMLATAATVFAVAACLISRR